MRPSPDSAMLQNRFEVKCTVESVTGYPPYEAYPTYDLRLGMDQSQLANISTGSFESRSEVLTLYDLDK